MKIEVHEDNNTAIELEVYKVQVAVFGGPSVLIYNEDRTQLYETHDRKEVKEIRKFIGKDTIKCYIAGKQNEHDQIEMLGVLPEELAEECDW